MYDIHGQRACLTATSVTQISDEIAGDFRGRVSFIFL